MRWNFPMKCSYIKFIKLYLYYKLKLSYDICLGFFIIIGFYCFFNIYIFLSLVEFLFFFFHDIEISEACNNYPSSSLLLSIAVSLIEIFLEYEFLCPCVKL